MPRKKTAQPAPEPTDAEVAALQAEARKLAEVGDVATHFKLRDAAQSPDSPYARRAALEDEKRAAKAEVERVAALIEETDREVMALMEASGVASVKTKDYSLTLDRKLWASAGEGAPAALHDLGLDELVKPESVNAQTITAYVRELERQAEKEGVELSDLLPPELAPHVKVSEVFKVAVRKA